MSDMNEILTRGAAEIIDKEHLAQRLRGKKKLRIKLGIDPTARNIHLGRAVVLWKLRAFQDLGHKIVLIIGDFTGLVGDTSDKDSERPMQTQAEVRENMKDYIAQFSKIVNVKTAEIRFNSEWLSKLGYLEIADQADQFSLHEFEARENIAKRIKESKRVSLREVLYPLMQGYDSVAVKADVEVGGTDQRFNLLAGRALQKHYGQEPQDIITFDLLEGTDGRKMSSSWGNVINITDSPEEMYGKTMSIKDELIVKYLTMCAFSVPMKEVREIEKLMRSGKTGPRDAKARLAKELVALYHGNKAAETAEREFDRIHKHKEMPSEMQSCPAANETLVKVLTITKLAKSASDARRLIDQGGVRINGAVCKEYTKTVQAGSIVRAGKRNFVKIV